MASRRRKTSRRIVPGERAQAPNPNLKPAILEIVENQLRDNDPPETRQAYERLLAEGHSDADARLLIGNLIVHQIYRRLKTRTPFDLPEYVADLARLPELPDD